MCCACVGEAAQPSMCGTAFFNVRKRGSSELPYVVYKSTTLSSLGPSGDFILSCRGLAIVGARYGFMFIIGISMISSPREYMLYCSALPLWGTRGVLQNQRFRWLVFYYPYFTRLAWYHILYDIRKFVIWLYGDIIAGISQRIRGYFRH